MTLTALPRHSTVLTDTRRAADYYRQTFGLTTLKPANGWSWSTYTQGIQALYRQSGDQRFLDDNMSWGRSALWAISTIQTNPDTVKAGQTYFDLQAIDPAASLTGMDATMSTDLASQPISKYDWIDALFMGLGNFPRWAVRTGNQAYLAKMDQLYSWTRDQGGTSSRCAGRTVPQPGLYDVASGLWFRDCTYVGVRDVNGRPVFWGRGNGWVIAAMAEVLGRLPATDPHRAKYVAMLTSMAARLAAVQGADGFWRASLADPALYPDPETSGTGLITFAIAYGIGAGILDRTTYLPVVARAWHGLTTLALQPNGFVAGCQAAGVDPRAPFIGKAPRVPPSPTTAGTVNVDSPPFCVGAFLLAGSEVARLTTSLSTGRPVAATSAQVGNEPARAVDGNVTTRWSAKVFPQSITVDLGSIVAVSNSMVVTYLDRAYRYRIQTSVDGLTWQLAVDRTANTLRGTRLDDFGTRPARYVRLTVTGVTADPTTWVSIQEFAVYGG